MSAIHWKTGVSGDWSKPSDWSGNAVPGSADDVTIGAAGTYTVTVSKSEAVDNLTLSDADATLAVNDLLTVGGRVDGGTIDLTASGNTGPEGGVLVVTAGATIDNETIDVGYTNAPNYYGGSFFYVADPSDSGAVATLGHGSNIQLAGRYATLGAPNSGISAGIDNQGTITLGYVNHGPGEAELMITSTTFINDTTGVISVSNGDVLNIRSTNFDNKGTINVTTGAFLSLPPGWINSGTINATDAAVELWGTFTTAEVDAIHYFNDSVYLSGYLDNNGSTLDVTASPGTQFVNIGTISGGIVHDATGALQFNGDRYEPDRSATLDGVTYEGTLRLVSVYKNVPNSIFVTGGLTLTGADGTGPGTADIKDGSLFVNAGETLNGATIILRAGASLLSTAAIDLPHAGDVLTLGQELTIEQEGPQGSNAALSGYGDGGIDNQGNIYAGLVQGNFMIEISAVSTDQSFINDTIGMIHVSNGDTLLIYETRFDNKGTIIDTGTGSLVKIVHDTSGGTINDGTIEIRNGARLEVGAIGGSGSIALGSASTLDLTTPAGFSNNITWSIGGVIDLEKTEVNSVKIVGEELVVTPTDGAAFSYHLNGSYAAGDVPVTGDDQSGGTTLTLEDEPPCFLAGSRIRTTRGEVAVEDLREGDTVLTASGRAAPVRWVGRSRFDLATISNPSHFRPIRIRKDAIAPGVPARDLLVSRGHALCIDGVLIPALYLLNGASIVEDRGFDVVTYYHVELDRHDILIADGMPAESYLDTGNRHLFESGRSLAEGDGESCAPVVQAGEALLRIRAAIAARIEATQTREPDLHLLADGVAVAPLRRTGKTYRFALSDAPRQLRLMSRANISPRIGAVPDMRMFGVAVTEVLLRAPGITRALDLTTPDLTGFSWPEHSRDGAAFRWTDGDAVLPAALWQDVGAFTLDVTVSATVPYWIPTQALAVAV